MASATGMTAAKMLAIDAQSIVGASVVGDNLILTKRGGATVNAGDVRGLDGDDVSKVTEMGNAVDLNTMTTPGYYSQSSTAEAAAGTNYPVGIAGILLVVTNPTPTNMVWQTYTVYGGAGVPLRNSVWTRSSYNGVWSTWSGSGGGDWAEIPLLTNWDPYNAVGGTYRVPEYKVSGQTVKLRGLAKISIAATSTSNIGQIPVAYAPVNDEIFQVSSSQSLITNSQSASTTGTATAGTAHTHTYAHTHTLPNTSARLDVLSSGIFRVLAAATYPLAAGGWVSLDGVEWDWN